MRLILILATILANSLTNAMILNFVPGGDAIKNVVSPFLSSFNTTDDSGNPTYTANLVRVVDPILAMQFAQNDMVSSPEDYSRPLHPSYFVSRSSLDYDNAADPRLAYPYYVVPGNPPPESEFVADPKEFGSPHGVPSSYYITARDPIDVYRASNPGPLDTFQGVFSPYYATPSEGLKFKEVSDIEESQKLSKPYHYLGNPHEFNTNSYLEYVENNRKLPYPNYASINPLESGRMSDSRKVDNNQKLPFPLNISPALPVISERLSSPRLSEDNTKISYPDKFAPLSPFEFHRADPILATDSQKLTEHLDFVPINPFASNRVSDLKHVENSQKLPQTLSLQNSVDSGRMNVPTYEKDYRTLPYPYNLAAGNPLEFNQLSNSRRVVNYQKLPTPLNLAPMHPQNSVHDSLPTVTMGEKRIPDPVPVEYLTPDVTQDPKITIDSQKLSYPLKLGRENQLGSDRMSDSSGAPYTHKIPHPVNLLSATPLIVDQINDLEHAEDHGTSPYSSILTPGNIYQAKHVINPIVDDKKLPYPKNLPLRNPVDINYVSDPRYTNKYQQPSYFNKLVAGRPVESGPVSGRQQITSEHPLVSPFANDLSHMDAHPTLPLPLKFADNTLRSNYVSDSGITDGYKLTPPLSILPSNSAFETNSMSGPMRSVDRQKLPFPYNLASMSPIVPDHISSPKYVENYQQLPYLHSSASTVPLKSDRMRDVLDGKPQLPSPPTQPLHKIIELNRMNDPKYTDSYQELPSPYNLASSNPVGSAPMPNIKHSEYLKALPFPLNMKPRNPAVSDQLTSHENLGNLQRSPHRANLASMSPFDSDQVADPRHLIPMLRRGFDLFNPWSDFPDVYPVAPSKSYKPSHFQHYKRLRPEYYREDDTFYPGDYYLTDYVYPIDDYPIIERFSSENLFQPTADSLVSNQPNLRQPSLMSRAEKSHPSLQSAGEHLLRSPSKETPSLALDQIQQPFRGAIESLLRGQNSLDNIPPMYRTIIKSILSGNSGLPSKSMVDSPIESTLGEPILGESPRVNLKSGNAIPNGPHASEYQSKSVNPNGESYRVQLNPNFSDDARSSTKSKDVQSSGSNPSVKMPEAIVSKSDSMPSRNTNLDAKSVTGQRGVEHFVPINNPDSYHVNVEPSSSSYNAELGTEAGRIPTPETSRDTEAAKSRMDGAYRARYGPFVEDPHVGCWDWLNPKGKFEEDMFSAPNPLSKLLGHKEKSALPVATNNINYGIVEPNYGNYPIYSFDNTNPIQNFNHQTNPVFHPTEHHENPGFNPTEHQVNPVFNPIEPVIKPPSQTPSFWDSMKKPGHLIVSPIKKPLFSPFDKTVPMRYTDEEAQYLKDLSNNFESAPEAPAGTDFNADGVRTNWPKDPKTLDQGGHSGPETPLVPTVPEAQPGKIPALVIIPAKDQSQNRQQDPSVDTINSTKNYNLLPIQLPASFLNNLINSGLFSALFNNLPGSDPMSKAKPTGTFSLLSPAKHKIELYNPTLRGYHGAINPFAHHHHGIGYKSY